MKLTQEQLSELMFYLQELASDLKVTYRDDKKEILEFKEYNIILYSAMINVMREDPETKQKSTNKEQVFFLESSTFSIRQTTSFSSACLALLVFMASEDTRMAFDLLRQDFRATHPVQPGELILQ